jgi:molybdenum cofactor cytidylyltransferase
MADSSIAILLLAAGSSSRMGQSKQLLAIRNEPLLVQAAKTALSAKASGVTVVLGAGEDKHRHIVKDMPLQIVFNENWQKGMGSSIKAGLHYLLKAQPDLQAVIVMVCDQPLLTTAHLDKIISTYRQTNKSIVASFYSGNAGVPVLFDKRMFPELIQLPDEQGAKKIIQRYELISARVDFPGGEIDLDTLDEYTAFQNKYNQYSPTLD